MASFVYTPIKAKLMQAGIDLHTTGADVRAILCMTNTTADTDQDAATLSAISVLDEMDGSGYSRQALTGETVAEDAANNRGEFDAADATFAGVSAGTRQVAGILLYIHVDGTAGNDIPLAWIDSGGFPFDPGGGDIDVVWNAEGILQLT